MICMILYSLKSGIVIVYIMSNFVDEKLFFKFNYTLIKSFLWNFEKESLKIFERWRSKEDLGKKCAERLLIWNLNTLIL